VGEWHIHGISCLPGNFKKWGCRVMGQQDIIDYWIVFDPDQIREIIEERDKFLQEMEGQLKRNKNG